MNSTEFPRLLVATEFPPNASGGGPAVIRQKLAGWPAEKLLWWSCLPERDGRFGQKVASHSVAEIPGKLYPHVKLKSVKSQLLRLLWAPWAARHLKRTIQMLAPDVVWIIPHGWAVPPLRAALLGSSWRYHVSVHDYADGGDYTLRFGLGQCRRMAHMVDQLYARAVTRDVISAPMAEDMQRRTGKKADGIIRFGVDVGRLIVPKPDAMRELHAPLRIAYAGSIQVEKEFAMFVGAIQRIRNVLPRPVELHFFSAHSFAGRPWFEKAWMRERGNLPEAELEAQLRLCDWGFSPMSLTDHDPQYNRYSFPTKFIAYLGAQLPVITLGHPESALVKTAAGHQVGVCFQSNDVDEFARRLREAFSLTNPREHFASGIIECARADFDEVVMRSQLHAWLGVRGGKA